MADKLIIAEENHKFRIQWQFDDDDGGYLCQDKSDVEGDAPKERDEWSHWAASRAVQHLEGIQHDSFSAYWENEKQARAALRVAKEALKQERPMPEWAQTALAEGWTPPKGWKA
jgi:hypothetical protein